MSVLAEEIKPGIQWLTAEEALAIFDAQARTHFGISGDDFIRRYDAGEYDEIIDDPEHPEVIRLAMMMSLGRAHS